MPMRYEALRPSVSATTPVGTSKTACATRKTALTSMTSKMFSPPTCIMKMVLVAQMSDVASVKSRLDEM